MSSSNYDTNTDNCPAGRKQHHRHHHGLSGLLLLFIVIAMLVAIGSGVMTKMIMLITQGSYNIPAQGSKIMEEMTKICQGTNADVEMMDAPPPHIQAQCDSCDTLKYKAIVRTALGVVETALLWIKWPIGVVHAIYKGIRFGINVASGPTNPFNAIYGDGTNWNGQSCVADTLNSSISKVLENSHLRIPIGIDQKLLVQESTIPPGQVFPVKLDVADKIRGLSMGEIPVSAGGPNYDSIAIDGQIDKKWKMLNLNMYELFTISGDQTYAQIVFSSDNSISPTYTVEVSEEKANPGDADFTVAVTLRPEHAKRFADSAQAFLKSSFGELARTAGKGRGGIYAPEITAHAKNILIIWDNVVKIVTKCDESMMPVTDPRKAAVPPKTRDCWFPIVAGLYEMKDDMASIKTIEMKLNGEMAVSGWYDNAKGIAEEASYQMYGEYSSSVDAFSQTPLEYDATTKLSHFDRPGATLNGPGLLQYEKELIELRKSIFAELKSSNDCKPQTYTFGSQDIIASSCAFITSCVYDDKLVKENSGCMLSAVNLNDKGIDLSLDKGDFVVQMASVPIIPISRGNVNVGLTYVAEAVGIVTGGEGAKAIKSWGTYAGNCAGNDDRIIVFCLEDKRPECDMPGLCQMCWSATCAVKAYCDHATPDPRIVFDHEGYRFVVKGAVHPM